MTFVRAPRAAHQPDRSVPHVPVVIVCAQVKVVIFMTFWQGLVIGMVPGLTEEEAHKWTVGTHPSPRI